MSTVLVNVVNQASIEVFVSGDPNWDDQELMVNGQTIHAPYLLASGKSAAVSVNWDAPPAEEMMGVIFSQTPPANTDFYQLAIGADPGSGNLAVTSDNSSGKPAFSYTIGDQAPWSMGMTFAAE